MRKSPGRKSVRALDAVVEEFESALGTRIAARGLKRYEAALAEFEAHHYDEARRMLTPMAREYSDVAAVHEMHGLCLYRCGEWKKASVALERALVLNPGWIFNHAVLADCHRALGNHDRVEELWLEVAQVSPAPEIVAEARIVRAGSLADRGDLEGALTLMAKSSNDVARPLEHHLRQWYVVADLHDRNGNIIEARHFFERIARHDQQFADVIERLSTLGA